MEQSRILAKHLSNGLYCDSILAETEQAMQILAEQNCVKDSCIATLEQMDCNSRQIIQNIDALLAVTALELEQNKKMVRREKWQKRLLFASLLVLTTVSIAANH